MVTILQDFSLSKIAEALDTNEIAFWTLLFSRFPGTRFHNDPGILWFETGLHHDIFNRVLQTDLEPDVMHTTLHRVISSFQEHYLPFLWHVGPSSCTHLGTLLLQHGLVHYETEPGMAADLLKINEDVPVVSRLSIQPVTTQQHLQQWVRIWEAGSSEELINSWITLYASLCFDVDSPLHLFLGLLDDEPVATSGVFFGGGVAAIGPIGTLAQYRRQGIGAAMTLTAMQEARRHGYRISVLTASPMGINTYRLLGFQECCAFSTYLWHPL